MTQHFTRNTVSVAWYCPKCKKQTQHRVDDRRKGPCLECIAKLGDKTEERPARQAGLFQEEGE